MTDRSALDPRGPGFAPGVIDFFAGAGGLTAGFAQIGFIPQLAVEFDKWAAQTYAANFGDHVLACPIEDVQVNAIGNAFEWEGFSIDGSSRTIETDLIDVVLGGPPCQGFSPLGRMNDWDYKDPRNKLWRHYVRIL